MAAPPRCSLFPAPARLAAALLGLALALPGSAQDTAIPKKYRQLYSGLDAQVTRFGQTLPRNEAVRPLRRAAALTSMRCDAGADPLDSRRAEAALLELDALRRAGAEVIVLPVCYPLLTPAFRDPRPLLEQLANLANAVRLRDMALLVEQRITPAGLAPVQGTGYFRRVGAARLFNELGEEAMALAIALQPDYLTLVADPQVRAAGLRLSARQWSAYAARVATELPRALGDFAPLLGAGCGLWSDPAYLDAFAAVPGLGYIDLRFYPLVADRHSMLERVLAWPERARAIDPSKRILLSEAWLSKANAGEVFSGAPDPNVVARETFGFWTPLDAKFLRTLAHAARVGGIEVLGVSRPRHLFAYLDFFDPSTFRASARLLDELASRRAEAVMLEGELTETGRAFGSL